MATTNTIVRFALPAFAAGLVALGAWQAGQAFGSQPVRLSPDAQSGFVTIQAINAAVDETVACLGAKGITTYVRDGSGLRPAGYVFVAGADFEAVERAIAQEAECAAGLRQLEAERSKQQLQPTAEEFRALVARMAECVETGAQGNTLDGLVSLSSGTYGADPSFVMRLREDQFNAYVNCALAEEAATGISALPFEVVQ